MGYPKELTYDTLRSLAFGGITGAYAIVGAVFSRPVRLLKIVNTTDRTIEVSTDGVTTEDILPTQTFVLYDLSTNKIRDEGAFFRQGKAIYVRRPAAEANPTSGSVHVVVIGGVV